MTRVVRTLAATYGVEPVCQTLGVATSTHYARQNRTPSARDLRDRELVREIRDARAGYRQVYGQRRTWREPPARVQVGRDRVARLMRAEGLCRVRRGRRRRSHTP